MENGIYAVKIQNNTANGVYMDEEVVRFTRLNRATKAHRAEITRRENEFRAEMKARQHDDMVKAYREKKEKHRTCSRMITLASVIAGASLLFYLQAITWPVLVLVLVISFGVSVFHIGYAKGRRHHYGS